MDAAVAVVSVLKAVPALPMAIATPWNQIVDVVSGMIDAVKLMRDNRDECTHLITRVTKFLQSLVDEWRESNVQILDGTPTAARLMALRRYVFHHRCAFPVTKYACFGGRNLMTIRDDTTKWSRLGLLDSYIKRDRIKVAISRHGENLTDCFSTFQVRAHSIPS